MNNMKQEFLSGYWVRLDLRVPKDVTAISATKYGVTCRYCGSDNLIGYGHSKGLRCLQCKDCHRKFVDNKAPPGMKTPHEQIVCAVTMYWEGLGLTAARQHLQEAYNSYVSDSTIYEWVARFARGTIAASNKDIPKVGDVWMVLSTEVRIANDLIWFWDVFDTNTHFLLASQAWNKSDGYNASTALSEAIKKAKKIPATILTDNPAVLVEGLEMTINRETRRVETQLVLDKSDIRLLDEFRSVLTTRSCILKRFKQFTHASLVIQAWPVHYNYFRPHEIANNTTPAYKTGIVSPLKIRIR
jgi:putative transposase